MKRRRNISTDEAVSELHTLNEEVLPRRNPLKLKKQSEVVAEKPTETVSQKKSQLTETAVQKNVATETVTKRSGNETEADGTETVAETVRKKLRQKPQLRNQQKRKPRKQPH